MSGLQLDVEAERMSLETSHWEPDYSLDLIETTLGNLMRKVASEVPDRPFLVEIIGGRDERRRWTYNEFVAEAERVARGLLAHFEPGDRVAVYGTNCAEWVLLQHGMALAGILLVPVNPAYTASELGYLLSNSRAAGLFHDDEFRGRQLSEVVDEVLQQDLPSLRKVMRTADLSSVMAAAAADTPLPQVRPGDALQVQYTSGTTGKPKGGLLHHRGAINTARNIARRMNFPDGGVHINAMPMFHIAGATVTELGVIAHRGTFVLLSHWDPELMMEAFQSERGNATLIVPTMILGILNHPNRSQFDLSSWQTILSGASNVPAALVRRVHDEIGCGVCIIFGQTETNGPITLTAPDDHIDDQTDTVGRPLPHTEVRVVDTGTLETSAVGEPGEVWVRGFQTMTGYFESPQQTADTVLPDGWLRTGDIGTMDSRGYLRITGRRKEVIIRGGLNLYPKEIEDVIFLHPAVDQVAVVGLPDEKWGEIVAAVVSPKTSIEELSCAELDTCCRKSLSTQKIPSKWFFITDWPLTPSGKIQKHVLIDMIEQGALKPVYFDGITNSKSKI